MKVILVQDTSVEYAAVLQKVIKGKTDVGSVIHSDSWRGYNGLVDFG